VPVESNKTTKQIIILTALTIFLLIIDQVSKAFVRAHVTLGEYIPILSKYLGITYSQNTGAAFGIFSDGTVILTVISTTMAVFCLWLFFNTRKVSQLNNIWGRLSLSLLFTGAVGNLIDRLFLGFVTDWIKLPPIPNFNVADSCITIAVVVIIVFIFLPMIFKKNDHA